MLSNLAHGAAATATPAAAAAPAIAPPPVAAAAVTRRSALSLGAAAALSLARPALKPATAAAPPPPPAYCGVAPSVPNWAYSVPWHESAALAQSTWYRDVNSPAPLGGALSSPGRPYDKQKLPLIVVHGGPGLPSDYLGSLELLAGAGRRVVFYDQAGCGRSAGAGSDASARALLEKGGGGNGAAGAVAFYVDELERLISRDLKVEGPVHLLGHGWGGILALEYAARQRPAAESATAGGKTTGGKKPSARVASVVAASTPAAYADLIAGRRAAAVRALGEQGAARLERADAALSGSASAAAAAGGADGLEDLRALAQAYDGRVVCRALLSAKDGGGPRACVAAARAARARPSLVAGSGAGAGVSSAALARRLNGGRFFEAGGELEGWAAPALPAGVPVLATRGEFDELSVADAEKLLRRAVSPSSAGGDSGSSAASLAAAAKSKVVSFPGAGSYAHLDSWEPYLTEIESWLSAVEGSKVSLVG